MFYRPHERRPLKFTKPSRTKQAFRDECDINLIMRRFEKTGMISHYNDHGGRYGDFIGAPDYQTALNLIIEANNMFESLPSKVRARFANDPGQFLAFVQDPENSDEMIKLGLKRAEKPAEPSIAQAGGQPAQKSEKAPTAPLQPDNAG